MVVHIIMATKQLFRLLLASPMALDQIIDIVPSCKRVISVVSSSPAVGRFHHTCNIYDNEIHDFIHDHVMQHMPGFTNFIIANSTWMKNLMVCKNCSQTNSRYLLYGMWHT